MAHTVLSKKIAKGTKQSVLAALNLVCNYLPSDLVVFAKLSFGLSLRGRNSFSSKLILSTHSIPSSILIPVDN